MRILALLVAATLLLLMAPAVTADDPDPLCIPTNGGNLDYYSEVCIDPGNAGCRVWHEDWTGRTCYVPV